MTTIKTVLCTFPDADSARETARSVIEHKFAACAQILPGITSIYHWDDNIQEDSEVLLILKCSDKTLAKLEEHVLGAHPYDTPQFVAIDAAYVSEAYGSWINSCLIE